MDPKFGKAHALQAFMLYGEKKYAAAADKYAVALKLDDSDPLDMVRYGHCFVALGKPDDAKAAYIAALKRHPDNDTAIRSGLYYLANRSWREAGPIMAEAAAGAPKSAPTWYYLGYTQFLGQDWEGAAESFRKAMSLSPKTSSYVYFLGYALEKQGDARGALAQYRKALQLDPNNVDAAGRFELIIRGQTDFDTIEKLYEELARLAPEQGFIFNDYGLVLRNWAEGRGAAKNPNPPALVLRRLKRSGEIYEIAAKLVPDDAQVQSDTGLLFEYYPAIRDDAKAKKYFTRSLEISEYTYRDAFDGLNRLCQRSGDWETLLDYAEGVIGALERGGSAVAPVGAGAPRALGPQQTAALLARAKAAAALAKSKLG
jgi:tetratricopeptide (TPR) repeat protein